MKNNYGAFIWKIKHKFNTQAAFCKAAGISANTLTNYINGKKHKIPVHAVEISTKKMFLKFCLMNL